TYLANPGEDPNVDIVFIPQAAQLIVAYQLQYVTFRGLTFQHDNYIVAPTGHVSSELEADLTSALSFQNSSHIKLDVILLRNTAGGGVDLISCLQQQDVDGNVVSPAWCTGFDTGANTAQNTIVNSGFFDLGAHGIRIGENSNADLDAITTFTNLPNGFE